MSVHLKIDVFHRFPEGLPGDALRLLRDIQSQIGKIMSAISDFADKMKVHNDHVDKAVEGLQGDVKNLSDQIAALQASAGKITPEDQALLDGIESRTAAIHDKLDALDALTPPVAPPVPA